MIKKTLLGIPLVLLVLVLTIYVALESGGVIIVETRDIDQHARESHIWFVEVDDRLALEAGSPDNPWVKDLTRMKTIQLRGEGFDGEYAYTLHTSKADHNRIRGWMGQKYGWRDAWISLLIDTSRSALIKLEPVGSSSVR